MARVAMATALDPAALLAEWDLPPEFATLRRLMEARILKMGRRECVQVRTPAREDPARHHLKTRKLPTLLRSMRSLPANVPPKGCIMPSPSPVWSSWRCPAASAARS